MNANVFIASVGASGLAKTLTALDHTQDGINLKKVAEEVRKNTTVDDRELLINLIKFIEG